MRLGARICGEPCWDPDFNTADLVVLLDPAQLRQRYARRFLKVAA
jgi:putative hemolysin